MILFFGLLLFVFLKNKMGKKNLFLALSVECLDSARSSQDHIALRILTLDKSVVSEAETVADVS